ERPNARSMLAILREGRRSVMRFADAAHLEDNDDGRGSCSRRSTVSRSRALSAGRKDRRELMRWHDLELRERTVTRWLVRSPPSELRRMAKAPALHVVVRDLDDELRTQRLPREIFALTPSAPVTGSALRRRAG